MALREVQRLMCIAGICISALLVFVSLALKNPRLGDEQSFEDAEGFTVHQVTAPYETKKDGANGTRTGELGAEQMAGEAPVEGDNKAAYKATA